MATSIAYFEAQRAVRDFLRHVGGYEYLHHDDEALRRERGPVHETFLLARLETQVRRLNPDLSESAVSRACRQLYQPETSTLGLAQKLVHELLLSASVRFFDFVQPANNNFLLVEALRFSDAPSAQVCDFTIFVNGIPLALVAVGSSNTQDGLAHGAQRLVQMQAATPRLFHTAQILLCVQKNFAGVGAASGNADTFASWEEPYPMTWDELRLALRKIPQRDSELPTAQDLALAGVLTPSVLLDLFKNFLTHVYGKHGLVSRMAWSQQYHAVRTACARLGEDSAARAGVIWHAGNSGKTHTLAWLAAQARALPQYAPQQIFIVTACAQQRERVQTIFAQHQLAPLYEAQSVEPLLNLMRRARPEIVLLSHALLQELLPHAAPEIAPRLFLFDERTNEPALVEVQRAFPQARIVACLAQPLRRASTCALWHHVSPGQAQRRGYLAPVRLETRLPRLHHDFAAPRSAAMNTRRITAIAEDLLEHFAQEFEGNHGKALLLAHNAQEAAHYFAALENQWPQRVAVLLDKPESSARELLALYRRFGALEDLLSRWHDPQDELRVLILAVPVHEDLRAPHVHAVYVDRELRGEELLRALALTQMPEGANKSYGLLVDYYGVSQHVATELAQFDFHQAERLLAPRYAESDFEALRLWRRELRAMVQLYPEEENFEAWLLALEPAELRRAFARTWQGYLHALAHVLPRAQDEQSLMQEAIWFERVRREAAGFYFDPALAQAHGSAKVQQMLENATRIYGVPRVREAVRVTADNFMQEVDALASVQARGLRVQYALGEEIRQNMDRDPVFYQALQQRVAKITAERQQKAISEEEALQRLRTEALRLRSGALATNKGTALTAEAQAYWRVLVRYLAPRESEHSRYEELAARLLAALEPDTKMVDWTIKEDWQREMRRKIKHLLREIPCPEDLLDPLTQAVMQLTKARFG